VQREITGLKELVLQRIEAVATIRDEKFDSVDEKLALIERQRVEQKKDTKDAVDAALAAAKEAVKEQTTASERAIAKSEAATTKSIDQLGEKQDTANEGIRREMSDLKDRIVGIEQQKIGGLAASTGIYALAGFILVVLLIAGAVVAIVS